MPDLDFKDLFGGGDGKSFFNKKTLIIGGIVTFIGIVVFQKMKGGASTPPPQAIAYPDPNMPTNDVQTEQKLNTFQNIMMGQLDQSLNNAFTEMQDKQNSFQQSVNETVQEKLAANTENIQDALEQNNDQWADKLDQWKDKLDQNNDTWQRKWEQVQKETENVQNHPDDQEASHPENAVVYRGHEYSPDEFTDVVGTDFDTEDTVIRKGGKSYTYDRYVDLVLDGKVSGEW